MKKLMSINYSAGAFNAGMLIFRIAVGAMMIHHGYGKLANFTKYKAEFMNFMGLGSTISLSLVVFAEFFCALFIIIGLFTRLVCIPLIIAMAVGLVKAHNTDIFGEGEMAALYLSCFLLVLFVGPGKYSVDGMRG